MGDTTQVSWLAALARAERFYDGPIPPALRRAILLDTAPPEDATQWWRRQARANAQRLRRLKPPAGFAVAPDARRQATRVYRRELEWCRHCVERWRDTRPPPAPRVRDDQPGKSNAATMAA